MENFNHILLFKTNIDCAENKDKVQKLLDNTVPIQAWNIDLLDEDYVLRIVSEQIKHQEVIDLIQSAGFHCQVLK